MSDATEKPTEWWKYVELLMRLESLNPTTLAQKLDIAATTPFQWKNEGRIPRPEVARRFAIIFGRPVAEAFEKAGFATAKELGYTAPPLAAGSYLSNKELMATLASRLIPDEGPDEEPTGRAGTAVKQTRAAAKKATDAKTSPVRGRAPR